MHYCPKCKTGDTDVTAMTPGGESLKCNACDHRFTDGQALSDSDIEAMDARAEIQAERELERRYARHVDENGWF